VPGPTLVVMAAGLGSRYGGLKQIDPVGPEGEVILEYSVFDALRAGFEKVVFLIRHDIEDAFREKVGRTVERRVDTAYAFQELDQLPAGRQVPGERRKPWGTGHAVLACGQAVSTPFAVVNADDFYGATAFQALAGHLRRAQDQDDRYDYSMVGYRLDRTLSEFGQVARGICVVSPEGELLEVRERTRIEQRSGGVEYTDNGVDWIPLAPETMVSLNAWGFTPSVFAELRARFVHFLERNVDRLPTAEFFLPDVVGELIREQRARVHVLPTAEKWFGVTYPGDVPRVRTAIAELTAAGLYPRPLWKPFNSLSGPGAALSPD
jgi:hypothetical protein